MRSGLEFAKQCVGEGATGVEIGVAKGDNAVDMLKNWDLEILHLVDNYSLTPENFKDALEAMFPYKHKIEWHKDDSAKVSEGFKNESLDFVYVDGGHDFKSVKKDLELWTPKVRKGGVVCGHDLKFGSDTQDHKDIVKAIDEYTREYSIKCYCDFQCGFPSQRNGDWWFKVGV